MRLLLTTIFIFTQICAYSQIDIQQVSKDFCDGMIECLVTEDIDLDAPLQIEIPPCIEKLADRTVQLTDNEEKEILLEFERSCRSRIDSVKIEIRNRKIAEISELCDIGINVLPTRMNVFYEVIKNEFNYTTINLDRDSFNIKSSQGNLGSKGRSNYISGLTAGEVDISFAKKNRPYASFYFRVKEIPKPRFYIDGTKSSLLEKSSLMNTHSLSGEIENFDWKIVPQITEYTVNIYRKGILLVGIENSGSDFSENTKATFRTLETGDVIQFENIAYDLIQSPGKPYSSFVKSAVVNEIIYIII